jgi:membrane protease subunit HflC
MTTRDKQYLEIGTFARWRITDPLQFFVSMRDERTALSRLDDNLGSSTRSTVANHDLIELIRTDKDRKINASALPTGAETAPLINIREGRVAIEEMILKQTQPVVKKFGIEILDVRFKRLNYSSGVLEKIHARMISEREQIAARFRSEGEGEAARISGTRGLELNKITSEAYRKIQEISGTAEAKASATYAEAFNASPQAAEFYAFQKTLETYGKTASSDTTVVFSTGSDLFRLMKTVTPLPPAPAAPAKAAAPTPPPAAVPAPTPAVEPVPAGQ